MLHLLVSISLDPIHLSLLFIFSNSHNGKPSQVPFPSPFHRQISSLLLYIVPSILLHPFFSLTTRRFSRILLYQLRSRSTPPPRGQHSLRLSSRVFRNARVARFMDRPRASRLSAGQDYRRQPSLPSSSEDDEEDTRVYWYELHARNDMCIRVSKDFHRIISMEIA